MVKQSVPVRVAAQESKKIGGGAFNHDRILEDSFQAHQTGTLERKQAKKKETPG